ncbi:MAG TPA: DUF2975 domain-containing protein [Syntrophomonadaceae bacterium]|nr:DUF2975 domain-containing protein [Syntrophomonadaceae bacterium]HPR94410.1 DUF2975 domain-containing protein [Syntrophomonadaceae bacterium]
MWNGKRSIGLSKFCILVFVIALIAIVVSAPWLTGWFVNYSHAAHGNEAFFLVTIYIGAIPAGYLLYNLFYLLRRIEAGQIFITKNVECLRRISWSCFVGAGIALISGAYYLSWLFVFVAAAFMGLIVRVVKNVVAQAVALKDEADYTI